MGKYTNQYRNAQSIYNSIGREYRLFGSQIDGIYKALNDTHNNILMEYYQQQMQILLPQMIKEMEEEVYQRVVKDIKIDVNMDPSQLNKSIQDAISSAFKGIG